MNEYYDDDEALMDFWDIVDRHDPQDIFPDDWEEEWQFMHEEGEEE